uniref:Uncharacterized protein n=1 Tax=uncultured alpha proteobacterium HF0130_06E21 TaxID=710808 RepID=E0XT04_9PROT|nr:hypothetical protein [uncultured alpha proteobacterium HF0130_06E21]
MRIRYTLMGLHFSGVIKGHLVFLSHFVLYFFFILRPRSRLPN